MNNIDKDIKIIEKRLELWKVNPQIMIQPENFYFVQALGNAINRLKEYDSKIIHLSDEEYRKVIDNAQADLKSELAIKGKMIDSMANTFLTIAKDRPGTIFHYLEKDGFLTEQCSPCHKQERNKNWTCAECFKEYFRKEAENNE